MPTFGDIRDEVVNRTGQGGLVMRRMAWVLVLLVVCGCSAPSPFLMGVQATWLIVGPEYRQYVENDADLSSSQKTIRLDRADTLDILIAAELARQGFDERGK